MFDQLENLHTSRTNWSVKVRITRMWASVKTDGSNTVTGHNAILLDDDNFHIQAFIYPDKWNEIRGTLVEGEIYVITNFSIKEATARLKPVCSKYIINFINSTTVEKVLEDDFMIPKQKFDFVDLGDLFEIASSCVAPQVPEYATDVIGVVEKFERMSSITTRYGEKNIVRFRICDGRHSPKVTVWGRLVEITDKSYQEDLEKPVIAILTSVKLQTFMNSVQINTLPSSKIYFNLDTNVVNVLRKSLGELGYKSPPNSVQTSNLSDTVHVIETMTLKELTNKTSTEYIKRNVLCCVTIKRVEAADSWWYYGCNFCKEEVHLLEGRYKCLNSKCKKNSPFAEKRYRIMILAEDKTEAVNVVLSDRAVKRLVGKTATKLLEEIEELKEIPPDQSFPQLIMDIANKDVTLYIQISEDNILINSTMYNATDAYGSKKSKMSTSESVGEITDYTTSGIGESVEIAASGDTPDTAKSCNKKIKKEH